MKCETCEKYDDCRNGSGLVWPCWAYVPAVAAADVVEVVRCRECKHAYINSFSAASGSALCRRLTKLSDGVQFLMRQDDFCSYGEKEENRDE